MERNSSESANGSKRTERERKSDGTRIRQKSRRKTANAAIAEPVISQETTIDENRWWVKAGWWAIDTSNTNSWNSAKDLVLARSKADIICTDRHARRDQILIECMNAQCRRVLFARSVQTKNLDMTVKAARNQKE